MTFLCPSRRRKHGVGLLGSHRVRPPARSPAHPSVWINAAHAGPCAVSLKDLVDDLWKPQPLDEDNPYDCESCATKCPATRRVAMTAAPDCLFVTLNRFAYDAATQKRSKLMTGVDFPEVLEIPLFPHGHNGQYEMLAYTLRAVIVHSGPSLDAGHYYTYASDPTFGGSGWCQLNDDVTSRSSLEAITRRSHDSGQTPYMLVYVSVEAADLPEADVPARLAAAVQADNEQFRKESLRSGPRDGHVLSWGIDYSGGGPGMGGGDGTGGGGGSAPRYVS